VKNTYIYYISAFTLLFFLPFLGAFQLFDWDEVNFAECAREMLISGDYSQVTINFTPFWEKPPLFIWMQAASMKLFGINEFAARLPNVLAALFTFLFLFRAGKELKGTKMGVLWIICFAGSILPNLYFHSGIIDPWFNLFIILAIYYAYKALRSKYNVHYLYSGLFIGLAVLTKGPVGILLFMGIVGLFILFNYSKYKVTIKGIALFSFTFILVGGFWFFILLVQGKEHIIADFINYQIRLFQTKDAGHGGPFYYHFIVLLLGCFPASIYALQNTSIRKKNNLTFLMILTLLFTLLLFSIVQTKIIHYSSLCYFPISFLAADYLFRQTNDSKQLKKSSTTMCIGITVFFILITSVTWILDHPQFILNNFGTDSFTKDALSQGFDKQWTLYVPSLFLFGAVILMLVALKKKQSLSIILGGYLSIAITLTLLTGFVGPRIAQITQSSHVEFCQNVSKEDVYVKSIGFKSFVPLFYGNQKKPDHLHYLNEGWLVNGLVDKPVFFTSRSEQKKAILESYPNLHVLYDKGGFTFYSRKDQSEITSGLFPEKNN